MTIHVLVGASELGQIERKWHSVGIPEPNTSTSVRSDHLRIYTEFDSAGLAVFAVLDIRTGTAVYIAAGACRARQIEGPYPFIHLLRWWSENTPLLWTHAAAVGDGRSGVLITGVGGSGKSSTALAVTGNRLKFLSDDYVLMGPDKTAYSIYASLRVRDNMVNAFEVLDPWFGRNWYSWRGKPSQTIGKDRFGHLSRRIMVAAIVTLRHGCEDGGTFHRSSAHAAMRAMTPVTVSRYCAKPKEALNKLASVIAALPVYEFHTSANLLEMRGSFERFVESILPAG